jgi:hypothetical protein
MGDPANSVSISRSLRPSRVAILVDPANVESVREAMSWATSSWGGLYWPIVPVMKRRPRWWGRSPRGESLSTEAIVSGYLEAYDPDWVVSLVEGYRPPVMASRLAEVGPWGITAGAGRHAADTIDTLVEYGYETRFRFQEHLPPQHVIADGNSDTLWGDVLLGCLSAHPVHERLKDKLVSRLKATPEGLDPDILVRTQAKIADRPELVTPLTLGSDEFLLGHRAKRWSYIYFCSLRRAWDAVEFWNLRAAGLEVFACPLQWAEEIDSPLQQLLQQTDVLPIAARRLTAREIEQAERRAHAHRLPIIAPPVFWAGNPRHHERPARVVAANDVVTYPIIGGRIELSSLSPAWAATRRMTLGGWINEFEIHDDLRGGETAGVLPHDLESVEPWVEGDWLNRPVRLHEGRLVVGFDRDGATVSITSASGTAVFQSWLYERGLSSRLSDPGRTALEMARKLEGVAALRWTLGPERLRLLQAGTRRRYLPQQQVLRAIRDDGAADPRPLLHQLTHHGALRSGLLLDCPRCRWTNFLVPEELGEHLRCGRCLETFDFPHERPPRQWAYKPVGPFAVPDFAAGAYATLLALRVLVSDSEYVGTWTPSMEVAGIGELDFAVWRKRRFFLGVQETPELWLGEAKSFDRFEDRDVERLLTAREALGQGWLCFTTLRDSLDAEEKQLLRAASQEIESESDATPLIVLTSLELWSRDLVTDLNRRLMDEGSVVEAEHYELSADRLATITQQLHL